MTKLLPLGAVLAITVFTDCSSESPVELGDAAPELVLPDLTGLNMSSSLDKGLALALAADMRQPWQAFTETLELGTSDCPDLFAPAAESETDSGPAWEDSCTTAGDTRFEGALTWTTSASRDQDEDLGSQVDIGERRLEGSATVEQDQSQLFGFSGVGSDSYYQSSSSDSTGTTYVHWTYRSLTQATVSGEWVFPDGSSYTGGWREDLYLDYAGGDLDLLEMRGDLFLLHETLDRFDSISLDMTFYGERGSPPEACTLEPYGYIGLRDTSAYWYEVIFLPSDQDSTDTGEGVCDACGTLFVRGVEQVDPVCVSLDWIWDTLSPPVLEEYVYSTRY